MLHMDLIPHPGNNQSRLAVEDVRTGLVETIDAATPRSPGQRTIACRSDHCLLPARQMRA